MIVEKKCSCCEVIKSVCNFHKKSGSSDGYRRDCKECRVSKSRDYYLNNLDKVKESSKNWRKQNPDKLRTLTKTWADNNKDRKSESARKYRQNHKSKLAFYTSQYRSRKLRATPRWLTREQFTEINDFFEMTKMFQIYTGQQYHVDHIVPLKSNLVCGLNVPWNLQILPDSENQSKSNKYWPDMP